MSLRDQVSNGKEKARDFLRRHGRLRLLIWAVPILVLLWVFGGVFSFAGGLLHFLTPFVVSPGGRLFLLNVALALALLVCYRRFRLRLRRTIALAGLRHFLAGLRAVAVRDPGTGVKRFRKALRWARLVPDATKALPELPDLLPQVQIRFALALADMGELEEALRVLLGARAATMPKETRRAFEEASALLYARHPEVLEETSESGLRAALRAHPRSVPLLRALREQLVRAGRYREAAEASGQLIEAMTDERVRREESVAQGRLQMLIAAKDAEGGKAKEARLGLRRAAELSPGDPLPALLLGDLEARAGNVAAALREWGRAPSLPALDKMEALLTRGEISVADVINGVPVAGSLRILARYYVRRGDVPRALRAAQIGLDLMGPDPDLLLIVGEMAERSGRKEESERAYAEAWRALAESPASLEVL